MTKCSCNDLGYIYGANRNVIINNPVLKKDVEKKDKKVSFKDLLDANLRKQK